MHIRAYISLLINVRMRFRHPVQSLFILNDYWNLIRRNVRKFGKSIHFWLVPVLIIFYQISIVLFREILKFRILSLYSTIQLQYLLDHRIEKRAPLCPQKFYFYLRIIGFSWTTNSGLFLIGKGDKLRNSWLIVFYCTSVPYRNSTDM